MTLLLALVVPWAAVAQTTVEIGNPESTTTQYTLPVNMYYNYSLTQQIYTADEIGMAGTINSIAFEYTNSASFSMNAVQVYMMNVDKANFESNTDMVALGDATLVWEGTFSASGAGWVTIELATPFAYDGTSNLLVCCYDPTSGYAGNSFKFRTTATETNLGIAYYSDSSVPSLTNVTSFSGSKSIYKYRNNIQLDITAGSGPVCEKPSTFEVSNVDAHNAYFEWTSEVGNYTFEFKKASESEWTIITELENNTFTLNNLDAATTYSARVKAVCGTDLESGYKTVSFTTECEVVPALGYAENFNSYTAGTMPICWNRINTTTYSSYQNYPRIYSSNSYSTPNCLYFYSYYSSYGNYDPQPQYAILPEMTGLAGMHITLQARGYNANSTFFIGVMTDPADASTFVAIADAQALTTTYQEFEFDVPVDARGNYLAIMIEAANSTRTYNALYVDDITITTPPSCIKPTNFEVTASGLSATCTWVSEVGAYEIAHAMEATANPDENIAGTATQNTYTMNNLTIDADHYFWVRATCGGSNGNSLWVGPVSVHIGYCVPAPTSVDNNGISNVTFGVGDYVVNNDTPKATYADYHTQIGAVQAGVESTIAITFKTGYTYNTYVWVDLDNSLSFDANEVICYGESTNTNPTTLTLNFTIPADQTLGDYRLRIGSADSGLGTDPTAANPCYTSSYGCFQDYTLRVLEAPSCLAPTGLTVANVTAHEADLTWTSDAASWVVEFDTDANFTNPLYENVEGEPTLHFQGMAPETTYYVHIMTNCTGSTSEWSNPVSFTTGIACPAPTGLTAALTPGNGSVATLSWTSDASAWVVAYKVSTDTVFTEVSVTENPYILTGLTPEIAYTAKVKAVCGGNDGESQWSSTINFTPTNAYMLTVNDGTTTNGFVPIYGFYVDSNTKSQFIIPADVLGNMAYGSITQLTFYATQSSVNWGSATFEVYMTETEETTLSALIDYTTMTKVRNAASLSIVNGKMVVALDTPYDYMGGNLLIGFNQPATGSYVTSTWYGISATGASLGGYGTSVGQQNFLPKTTFDYLPGEAPACPKPTGLAVNYTGGTTATVTWTGEAEAYNIDVNGQVTEGVTSPYTLEGLALATNYTVMVQANCGEDLSDWTAPVSFTTDLCLAENMCEISFSLTDQYNDSWNGASFDVIDVATNAVIYNVTMPDVDGPYTGSFSVCDGRAIQFVWNTGSYDSECGYTFTDLNGEEIFSGSGRMNIPFNYTVNCTVITCKKPKNLAASDIAKTSVVLSWTPGSEDQNSWRIAYKVYNEGTPEYEYMNTSTVPCTLTGLTPETTYQVMVCANCGGGDWSDWSDAITFTTAEACPMTTIEGFAASFITTNQAVLNWASTYESYEVHYKKVYGETEWSEILSTNSSVITLTGLTDGTEYEYQVRGLCLDVENAYTEWVDGINFTTASICGAPENLYVVPSTESATLTWTGYQNSYTVTCNGNVTNYVYGTTFNIMGLEPSHTYTATVTGEGDCQVFETASIEFTTGTDWNNGSAWVGGEAPEQGGVGTVADSTIVVIPEGQGTVVFDSLAVGEGSYIVIEPGTELIFGGEDPIPVVISFDDDDDEDLIGPRCRDELPGGYKLIAPPTFLSTTELYLPVDTTHLMDNAVNDLYSFDVNYPAAEWRNYKLAENNFVNLNWKQGYLYYYETSTGTWPGYAVPTQNASQAIALDYNAAHAYFPGANLIGNPFIVKGYIDRPFYVLNSDGDRVIASTEQNYVKAGKGFFVLAEGPNEVCTVTTIAPDPVQSLGITLSQECSKLDAAAIRFNDTKTLDKFQLNPNHTKIYLPQDGKDYAILYGEALGEMPLNFEAQENGTYTLSFKSQEVEFSYLHLIDNMTGVETNLLNNPSYTFNAQVTDYASRFRLVYATGSSVDGDSFGFINSSGNLCIYGIEGSATLQVIDAMGRIVSNETFSGSYEKKINGSTGVYMLRLINGNDVKVQKIVVR